MAQSLWKVDALLPAGIQTPVHGPAEALPGSVEMMAMDHKEERVELALGSSCECLPALIPDYLQITKHNISSQVRKRLMAYQKGDHQCTL